MQPVSWKCESQFTYFRAGKMQICDRIDLLLLTRVSGCQHAEGGSGGAEGRRGNGGLR